MEKVSTTDPMVILRDKGRCRASRKLLIRADTYDTMRARTVLPLHQIKTFGRQTKRQRTVRINNTTVENNGCRMKPDSSSGIHMVLVM